MTLKTFLVTVVAISMSIKILVVLLQASLLHALGWFVVGLWVLWIAVAYKSDKDLPMIGPSSFDEGRNQTARTIAATAMTFIFLMAAFVG